MNPDTLLTLADVTAGFIGFAAIATVLMTHGTVHINDRIRFLLILVLGMLNVLNCLMPFWIFEATGDLTTLWRNAMALALLLGIPFILWVLVMSRERIAGSRMRGSERVLTAIIFVVQIVLASSALFSWPFASSQRIYELAVVWNLVIMSIIFASLVLDRPVDAVKVPDDR